jgi:RND family efflux transporter MFP subunit
VTKRKLAIGFFVGVVIILGAWWSIRGLGGDDGDWVPVTRGDMVIGVEVEGTLQAIDSGSLGPPQIKEFWDYKISHMAPEGSEVSEGDVILGFDTSALMQTLQQFMAESEEAQKNIEKTRQELDLDQRKDLLRLEEARAKHRKAQLKVDVPEELEEGNDLAEARLDLKLAEQEIDYLEQRMKAARESADAELGALRNQHQVAERKVEEMQDAVEAMNVKAPRDGTVVYTSNWRDEKKKVGDSCWQGETVMELPDLDRMMAKGEVDEADAGRIQEDQPVTLKLDAHPDVEFHGSIRSIWRTVQRKSWRTPLKVVRLDIDLDETDTRRMRPGMRFRGEAEVERVSDVLLIPLEAVFTTDDGPVVYRRTLLGSEPVRVDLGRRNSERVEVVSGLEDGDRISRRDLQASEDA